MASNHTRTYALNQWSLSDSVNMADFNADNQKIEQALLALKEGFEADDLELKQTLKLEHTEDTYKIYNALQTAQQTLQDTDQELADSLNALRSAMPQIKTGTYAGTGTSGESAPKSLTFDFEPQLLIVAPISINSPWVPGEKVSPLVAIRGAAAATVSYYSGQYGSSYGTIPVYLTWNSKSVAWYSSQDITQHNAADLSYRYFAIG